MIKVAPEQTGWGPFEGGPGGLLGPLPQEDGAELRPEGGLTRPPAHTQLAVRKGAAPPTPTPPTRVGVSLSLHRTLASLGSGIPLEPLNPREAQGLGRLSG